MMNHNISGFGNNSQFERTPVILIADDDPSIRLVLRHVMEQCSYHVIEAGNGLEAIQSTIKQIPDLILMDAVMPEMDGFRATEEIKKLTDCQSTPILMATSLDDDQSISRAFDVGASDYITKPFNWSVLKHRITRMLFASEAEQKIRHLAYHDTLTGLPNRMLFMDRVDQAISRAQREHACFAFLFIDIDHFKVINDSMGHEAGDQLLNIVSQRLRDTIRKYDTVARLGGDEFTVLIEGPKESEWVISAVNKILSTINGPVSINNKEVHVGGSIGIAMYPQDGENFSTLLKNADTAMYKAKEMGRQTFRFYAAEMSQIAVQRLEFENQLRKALKEEEFVVHYQPKFDLRSDLCTGVEALVRWEHPERGVIQPCEFMPLAEEIGLIRQLDEWVIHTACSQFKQWKKSGSQLSCLSVNVSAGHFKESELADYFKRLVEAGEISAENLEIELTETALVNNYENSKSILNEIHKLGIRLALDDFGTGYASMSYLKEFPFDTVKIDQAFMRGIPDNDENTAIIKAVIQLAEALKLNLVAEGVETDYQKKYLADNGCIQAQGFLWSMPASAHEIESLVL